MYYILIFWHNEIMHSEMCYVLQFFCLYHLNEGLAELNVYFSNVLTKKEKKRKLKWAGDF